MPTHLDQHEPDTWNARTWVFPTLVVVVLFAFAAIYMYTVR